MTTYTQKRKIYKMAMEKFGVDAQLIAAIEELSELQVELCKLLNQKRPFGEKLIDELADVRIMIEQIETIFNCENYVEKRMDLKLMKLLERVK